MTARQRAETRMTTIRYLWWSGLIMYTSLVLGIWHSAWFALGAAAGLALCVAAVLSAMFCIRCTECRGSLLSAMAVTHDKRLLTLRDDISRCPRCHCDLNQQTDHENLVELLSAYDVHGTYRGVVELPDDGGGRRYELALKGDAQASFQKVLTSTPFKKANTGSYRYFYVPDVSRPLQMHPAGRASFLFERGNTAEVVEMHVSPALKKTLEWLSCMTEENEVMGLTLRSAPAAINANTHKLARVA